MTNPCRSIFGFRSASSTLAAQWSTLRFVVQLSYRSSFASLRFACAFTIKSAGQFYILAYRPDWHSLTPAWTVAGNEFTSYRDAADLMAPSSRQGQRALAAHGRSISAAVFWLPFGCLTTVAPTTLAMQALLLHDPGLSWHRCRCAGGLLFSALALPHRAV